MQGLLNIILLGLFFFSNTLGQRPWTTPLLKCWNYPVSGEIKTIASDNDSIIINFPNETLLINFKGEFLWKNTSEHSNPIQTQFNQEQILDLSINIQTRNQIIFKSVSKETGLTAWKIQLDTKTNPHNPPSFTHSQEKKRITLINNNEFFLLNHGDGSLVYKEVLTDEEPIRSVLIDHTAFLFLPQNKLKIFNLLDKPQEIILIPIDVNYINPLREQTLASNKKGQIFFFKKNKQLWTTKLGGEVITSIFDKENVTIASYDNYLYQFSKKNGKVIWKKRFNHRISKVLSLEDDLFFVKTSHQATLDILDSKTGKTINQLNLSEQNLTSEPKILVANNLLLIFTSAEVGAFSPNLCK